MSSNEKQYQASKIYIIKFPWNTNDNISEILNILNDLSIYTIILK